VAQETPQLSRYRRTAPCALFRHADPVALRKGAARQRDTACGIGYDPPISARTVVPITPSVLEWAMEQSAVTEQDVAARCKVDLETVREWLSGEDSPSKTQFNGLVALLKRPSAFFFLAKPPAQAAVTAEFRHPPGETAGRRLLPEEARAVRRARRFQKVSEWVITRSGSAAPILPIATAEDPPEAVADTVRRFFDWTPEDQFNAKDVSTAAKALRARLESFGLLVLHLPLSVNGCRGFSLYNRFAPLIAVNTAYNDAARLFSVGHELGHLILQNESICSNRSSYKLETWCDSFAAAFLMPRNAVDKFVGSELFSLPRTSPARAQKLASRFKVSIRAAAIRLIDLRHAPEDYYALIDRTEFKVGGGGGGGETSPEKRLREWGTTYPQLLLSAEERNLLTRQDVLEYLNLSNTQFQTFRELLGTGQSGAGS
jgi:Zn-dependent peptidase ImmA (M78 family)/transcriptional regulator with XRE-family HTH domain